MKTMKLLLASAVAGSLLTGCLDLSSDEKEELKAFLDGYAEESNEETSTSAAYEKDYLDTTEVTEADAVGSARIGGEIDAASVANRSLSQAAGRSLNKNAVAAKALDAITAGNFTVSFINGKGQKVVVDINASQVLINQPSTGNPQFIIEGMGDGINYIVDIAVTVDGGEPVNLKTVAFVPPGATKSEKVVLDPVSTVIAEAVTEKVKNGFFETGGDTFSQDYISDLKETMTATVEEVIANSDNFDLQDFSAALESEGGVDSLVSKLLADEEVNSSVNKLEDAAVAEKYEVPETVESNEDARARVADLFEQLDGGDGGGAPSFIIKFFGDKYAEGLEKTVDQIFTAIWSGVEIDDATQASEFSKAGALNAFTGELDFIFASLERISVLEATGTLTTAEETELGELYAAMEEVPDIILGIFPPSKASDWLNLSATSTLTVPQAITLVFYTLDVYLEDLRGYERNEDGTVEETDGADFNPEALLVLYGFNPEDATQAAEYASLDVNWLELHPGQVWLSTANDGAGGQVDILSLYTCVDAYPEDRFMVDGVDLTYPKANGTTGSVELGQDMYGHGACFNLNPWDMAHQLEEDFKQSDGGNDFVDYDGIWNHLVNQGLVITDFVSGDYTLTVTYADGNSTNLTKEVTFSKRVITGLSNLFPRFTSPNGLPKHPEPNASPEEWDAFNAAQAAFEITTFPTSDAVTFSWAEPELLATTPLPEGVVAVYNVDVGRDVCGDDPNTTDVVENYCRWDHVFSSWELGGQIFGTTFELPEDVKGRLPALAVTDTPYQANLSISFVDENTGEHLGQGGWTSAPFRVGEVLDLDSTFNLTGAVSNAPDANEIDPNTSSAYPISAYKVAAVQEECYEDTTQTAQEYTWTDESGTVHTETWYPWVCEINTLAVSALTEDTTNGGHTYTLQPTLRQMMNSGNAWIDIRLFIDADGDNLVDGHVPGDGMTEEQPGERMYWSHGNPPNFNNWGGVLRIGGEVCEGEGENQQCYWQDQIVVPDATFEGPDFDTQPHQYEEQPM